MNKKEGETFPKRLVIIPARGGSKRILGKNLIDVCGSPIIRYPIEAAISEILQLANGQKRYLEIILQFFQP